MDYQIIRLSTLPAGTANPALLSAEEQNLAARRGASYLLVRSLLRRELGRRLGRPPAEVRLSIGEHGKPQLAEGSYPTGAPLHFNLSHSGDLLALAFAHSPIGIDIERHRPRPFAKLAPRFMCPEQQELFEQAGCPEALFFDCWCAMEALIKREGLSLWQARQHPFVCEHGRIRLLQGSPPRCLRLITPAPGYSGAIACDDEVPDAPGPAAPQEPEALHT